MSDSKDKLLGKQIQKIRRERGLTQESLAEKVQLSAKYIQFIEAGKRSPSLKTIYKIANNLDTKVASLFIF